MHKINWVISLLFTAALLQGQSAHKLLLQGDDAYLNGSFDAAELNYRKAREQDNNLKANYNLANTTYKQERYEEAVEHYQSALDKSENDQEASQVLYNLGNAHFNNQNLEDAVGAYKQAIKLNPQNKKAQYNLALSKQILRQLQQQQEQEQQNQENQNQENQEQENEQQEQEQQNQEQQQKESDQQDGQEQQKENESKQEDIKNSSFDSTRLDKQELDSIDAQKLLQIIQSEELKVQERLRKFNSKRKKPDKDW